ncbi:MAG: hypothetical protein WBB01_14875 [Phormidesmis sp.]
MRALQWLSVTFVGVGLMLCVGSNTAKAEVFVETRGTLSATDAVLEDGSRYDQYRFLGTRGQQVIIYLESQDFDPYLILLDPQGRRIYENDDISRSDRNARLIVTLPSTGTYTAVANSYEAGKNGRYFIRIEGSSPQSSALERMVAAAVPGSAVVCSTALVSEIETLERDRDLVVAVSALPLSNRYKTVPETRPDGINMSFTGQAASSVVSSPQLLSAAATKLIQDCAAVGAVVFEASEISEQRTFGYLPGSRSAERTARQPTPPTDDSTVAEFTCATLPGEQSFVIEETSSWLEWGEQLCL